MKKFFLLILFISAIDSTGVFAQQKEVSYILKNNIYSVTVPFELIENLIVIDNIIVNRRKGKFIFDTGNQSSLVLNSVFFQQEISSELDKFAPFDSGKGITGNIPVVSKIKIDSIQIGDFYFAGFDAIAFNLEHVRKAIGKDFIGFIGYGILRETEFSIDYKNKIINIYKIDEAGNTLEPTNYKKTEILDLTIDNGSPMANIYFGGRMLNFFLDTGAPKNSINAPVVDSLDKTFLSFTGLKDTLMGGDGGMLIAEDALMTQLTLKDIVFGYMETNVYNFKNPGYDATLGYPFFSQKPLVFNFRKKKLYIAQ